MESSHHRHTNKIVDCLIVDLLNENRSAPDPDFLFTINNQQSTIINQRFL